MSLVDAPTAAPARSAPTAGGALARHAWPIAFARHVDIIPRGRCPHCIDHQALPLKVSFGHLATAPSGYLLPACLLCCSFRPFYAAGVPVEISLRLDELDGNYLTCQSAGAAGDWGQLQLDGILASHSIR